MRYIYVSTINLFIEAYRRTKAERAYLKSLDRFVGENLSYTILRELINRAVHGVEVNLTLKDGTKLQIKRENPLDALRQQSGGEYF